MPLPEVFAMMKRAASQPRSLSKLPIDMTLDFYNYFQYGLDFLISESTHLVKKIVLHTNVVSSLLQSSLRPSCD